MLNVKEAGKGRFEKLTSKYMLTAERADSELEKTTDNNQDISLSGKNEANIPQQKIENRASLIVEDVVNSVDTSIKKRRHPAYKGDRIARSYKILTYLDEWMDAVYEEEGVEKQTQITKALQEWLENKYSKLKV